MADRKAGSTPFLFTSDKELEDTGNRWYLMWVNPKSISISTTPSQTEQMTKRGYVFYHWRNMPTSITFQGTTGWIHSLPQGKSLVQSFTESELVQNITNFDTSSFSTALTSTLDLIDTIQGFTEDPQTVTTNNPMGFISRLQRVALQNKYFQKTYRYQPEDGGSKRLTYRTLNKRHIRIYTKRFPEGKLLTGVFTDFGINEDGKTDSQMINYTATFKITKDTDFIQEFDSDDLVSLVNEFL